MHPKRKQRGKFLFFQLICLLLTSLEPLEASRRLPLSHESKQDEQQQQLALVHNDHRLRAGKFPEFPEPDWPAGQLSSPERSTWHGQNNGVTVYAPLVIKAA